MLSKLLLAVAFQIGPFYQQGEDGSVALRPIYSSTQDTTDVLWPVFTAHRDWWRFCFAAHYLENDHGYQFSLFPLWWNGTKDDSSYFGLFPIWGSHPHILGLNDASFVLWPLYHSYTTPRADKKLRSHSVLFPFFHWREDGSWGVWPLYVKNNSRGSVHETALWPFVTWASYSEDRDTSGEGFSLMVWPLFGRIDRAREKQILFIPPFFSHAEVGDPKKPSRYGMRVRCPWPFFEYESTIQRSRLSIFPFYEYVENKRYSDGAVEDVTRRFGWRLVEILPNETRVFPFWVKSAEYFRLWPFWETKEENGVARSRFLSLFPIRHVPAVDRNWAKFWTFYEREEDPLGVSHSLLWGFIRWSTLKD